MYEDEEVLTVEEIATRLKVNPRTVRNWIASGELPAIDIGRGYRVSRADFEDFKRRRRTDQRHSEDKDA